MPKWPQKVSLEGTLESIKNWLRQKNGETSIRLLYTTLQLCRPPSKSIIFRAFRPPKIDEKASLKKYPPKNDEQCAPRRPRAEKCAKRAPKRRPKGGQRTTVFYLLNVWAAPGLPGPRQEPQELPQASIFDDFSQIFERFLIDVRLL